MKELIEHIRTVHFTLLVLCLILGVAHFQPSRESVTNAGSQARGVENLSKNLNTLKSTVEKLLKPPFAVDGYYELDVKLQDGPFSCGFPREISVWDPPHVRIRRSEHELEPITVSQRLELIAVSQRGQSVDLAPLPTLGKFVEFWNGQHLVRWRWREGEVKGFSRLPDDPTYLDQLLQNWIFPDYMIPVSLRSISDGKSSETIKPCSVAAINVGEIQDYFVLAVLHASHSGADSGEVYLRLGEPRDESSIIREWTSDFIGLGGNGSSSGRSYGRFESAFSDLNAAAQGKFNLPLSELVRVLDQESTQTRGEIEVFGAKLPFGRIGLLGALLILATQFYFWAHLRELKRRFQSNPEVKLDPGFIGLYPEPMSRVFVFLSLVGFPAGAQFLILNPPDTGYVIREEMIPFGTVLLGALSFALLCDVQRSMGLGHAVADLIAGIRSRLKARSLPKKTSAASSTDSSSEQSL